MEYLLLLFQCLVHVVDLKLSLKRKKNEIFLEIQSFPLIFFVSVESRSSGLHEYHALEFCGVENLEIRFGLLPAGRSLKAEDLAMRFFHSSRNGRQKIAK